MSSDRRRFHHDGTAPSSGILVLVVGASGVGKDALVEGARQALAREAVFAFPERVVTRQPHAAEKHISIAAEDFRAAKERGAFALAWSAHGIHYGIPIAISDDLRAGRVVVANVSRAIIADAKRRFMRVSVVLIECPPALRADRLARRGREAPRDIEHRLNRVVDVFDRSLADVVIDNSGHLEDGVDTLVSMLRTCTSSPSPVA